MWTKESPEILLATGKIQEYLKSFNTIDEVINDFSLYKTINYQLGIAIINTILNHITPERFNLFSRVISIKYMKGGMFDKKYYPPYLLIETDKGMISLSDSCWSDYNDNDHDLNPDDTHVIISEEKEIMIYSVINWIKQLIK